MLIHQAFYQQKTLKIARQLLGKILIRQIGRQKIYSIITETEAYCGPNDKASHASRGRTPRTEVMFGPAGRAYIYLIYGMYYCLNLVTEKKDYPAAVLIRGAKLIDPKTRQPITLLNGPGKLCRKLNIDKNLNQWNVTLGKKLWLEDWGIKTKPQNITRLPRVGIDYAQEYKNKPWRFLIKNHKSSHFPKNY